MYDVSIVPKPMYEVNANIFLGEELNPVSTDLCCMCCSIAFTLVNSQRIRESYVGYSGAAIVARLVTQAL